MQDEYRVEAIDDDKEPKTWTVKAGLIRRDKTVFTKEKLKLFLNQHVERFKGMLKVKEESLQKYVVERGLRMEEIFVGKVLDFNISISKNSAALNYNRNGGSDILDDKEETNSFASTDEQSDMETSSSESSRSILLDDICST